MARRFSSMAAVERSTAPRHGASLWQQNTKNGTHDRFSFLSLLSALWIVAPPLAVSLNRRDIMRYSSLSE